MKVKVGTRIDLASHSLTKSHKLRGKGTVTAIRPTNPYGDALVIVSTRSGYLHIDAKRGDLK